MDLQDTFVCPVCGYPGLTEPPYSPRTGRGSYDICPSCWFEYGVDDDDKGYTHERWRAQWIAAGMPWRFGEPPERWDPVEQLRRISS
jgi:hypothetical protein